MNREIEFRARIAKDSKRLGLKKGEWFYWTLEEWLNGDEGGYLKFIDRATIGQFTGLHDKNGKEIYEGDVCKDGEGDIWKVVYVENDAGFYFQNPWDEKNLNTIEWLRNAGLPSESEFEVIGDIYKNPELLSSGA